MSMTIDIPAHEYGRIRVFAINRPQQDLLQALGSRPKADLARALLSAPHLDTTSTEIFAVADLAGVGLAHYLTEGYAVPEGDTDRDRARLDALDGYVLLLFSDSFCGQAATLTPGPDVTLIGTYGETAPASAGTTLTAESAKAYTGQAQPRPPVMQKQRLGSGTLIVAGLIVLLVALWLVLA